MMSKLLSQPGSPRKRSARRARERGQMLIVAAGAMVVLLGFMGLVVDIGWSTFQKRVAQNAADAAVLAALRDLGNAATSCVSGTLDTAVSGNVTTYAQANAGADTTTTYSYIDNNGVAVATANNCTQATGVEVTVDNPYNTFFLSIIGVGVGSTRATAAGRVGVLSMLANGSPFIACGTALVKTDGSGVVDILDQSTNPPSVNETWIGTQFNLHGPQIGLDGGGCSAGSNFKGNADDTATCPALPCDYAYSSGTQAGPVRNRVAGALPGCDVAVGSNADNCILIVPVATGIGAGSTLHVVTLVAFYIQRVTANQHTGVLQGTVYATGPSTSWTPGQTGLLVLGLVA